MSFTKGVSFHHETNATSHPTINNNISITASNELSESNPYKVLDSSEVKYESPVQSIEPNNENAFLRKVLDVYMNQKLYWSNKYLVLSADELLELIQTLLPNKGVVITSNDLDDPGCCGFIKDIPVKKVESIWIDENDTRKAFKYAYSDLAALFDQYRISIKYVRSS